MNKILFDNIAKILSGKVSEILMQRKLSPLPSRTNVKELDMYPDLDLALSKADEEHLVNFLLTQCVESEDSIEESKYRDEIRERAKDILNVVKVKQKWNQMISTTPCCNMYR